MTEEENNWHLDRRVPVALIIALTGQLIGAAWFFASLTGDVEANTVNITKAEKAFVDRMNRHEMDAYNRHNTITKALIRIEDKLDRKVDK